MRAVTLPPGSHYAVAWGLEEKHGGMTSAMLHRSRAFARLSDTPVTVLTYDAGEHREEAVQALREAGKLSDRIALRNLWDDLASWSDDEIQAHTACMSSTDGTGFRPLPISKQSLPAPRVVRVDGGDRLNQADYYRADGTLLVSDRREDPGPRRVSLCDSSGSLVGSWSSVWRMYFCWLDTLPRDPVAFFIVDSKTSAHHFSRYQGEGAVKLHVVHGSHLAGEEGPHGAPNPGRQFVSENVKRWDAFVFLTERQRDDFQAAYGASRNLHVCPNSRDVAPKLVNPRRESRHGVVLANLTARKRLDHAITAMSRASARPRRLTGVRRPRLDVYGDGDRAPLEQLAAELEPRPNVRFHGFVTDTHLTLEKASYLLLTSISEGQPLVLIEAMAAGCIPIAYDIPYGPSDVITDGVDGFLVPAGDVDALAERIRHVASASPATLEPIRRAAHRRALDFTDEKVTRTWAAVLRQAARLHRKRSTPRPQPQPTIARE